MKKDNCCENKNSSKNYLPFVLSILFVWIYTVWHQIILNRRSWMIAMNDFMGVRFLLFWILKLFDMKWFVNEFSKYDILASRIQIYGRLFPFLEIVLWIAYLADTHMNYWIAINIWTVLIVSVTGVWILRSLRKKQAIDCVCMWTKFPLPMSNINFVENVAMWMMAVFMLIWMWWISFSWYAYADHSHLSNPNAQVSCH